MWRSSSLLRRPDAAFAYGVTFSLRTSQVGVTARRRQLSGYVTPHVDGPLRARVVLPTGRTKDVELRGRTGARAHWAVGW